MSDHYDVIIVGSGGTLAPSGKRILIRDHAGLDKNYYMSTNVSLAGCAHQAGTCRFGADPANLYVVDTSIFPSIGAMNLRSPPWPTRSGSASTC